MKELTEMIKTILITLIKRKIKNYIIRGCLIFIIQYIIVMILFAIILFCLAFCYGYITEIFKQALNK